MGRSDWDYCIKPEHRLYGHRVNGAGKHGLKLCEGDCDRNSDCKPGLRCMQRNGYTKVPGCAGRGRKSWDYCVKETHRRGWLFGNEVDGGKNLRKCEGYCDRNSDCKGGLVCHQRNGFTKVPGCKGRGRAGWDYCTPAGARYKHRLALLRAHHRYKARMAKQRLEKLRRLMAAKSAAARARYLKLRRLMRAMALKAKKARAARAAEKKTSARRCSTY